MSATHIPRRIGDQASNASTQLPKYWSRSSVPRATLHSLSWAVFVRDTKNFCTVRGIILAQCKHSPQPAATKANTRLTRTQEDNRKAPGSLPLRMHGDETILSSANTQGNQCCSHEHRQCDKRSLQPARAKTSRLARTQSVAQQIITIPVTKNMLPVTKIRYENTRRRRTTYSVRSMA